MDLAIKVAELKEELEAEGEVPYLVHTNRRKAVWLRNLATGLSCIS